jgi:hypothetical protein
VLALLAAALRTALTTALASEMRARGDTDEDLLELLRIVELADIVTRFDKGFDAQTDWNSSLSEALADVHHRLAADVLALQVAATSSGSRWHGSTTTGRASPCLTSARRT